MSDLLARISAATRLAAAGPLASDRDRPTLPPLPGEPSLADRHERVERFRAELEKLTGKVYGPVAIPDTIAHVEAIVGQLGARAILAWDDSALAFPGLSDALAARRVRLVRADVPRNDGRHQYMEEIAEVEVGLTGAQAGLADTGSVVVASGKVQARVASLLPPVHIALLPVGAIHATMADWLQSDGASLVRSAANVTVITGPSRTADIELVISLGVHGPREVHVVLLDDSPGAP